MTGQGRLAGRERGQGGGVEIGQGAVAQGHKAMTTTRLPTGTQTTLDSYRWADSPPNSQGAEGMTHEAWDEQRVNELVSSLEAMAAKARQLSPKPVPQGEI